MLGPAGGSPAKGGLAGAKRIRRYRCSYNDGTQYWQNCGYCYYRYHLIRIVIVFAAMSVHLRSFRFVILLFYIICCLFVFFFVVIMFHRLLALLLLLFCLRRLLLHLLLTVMISLLLFVMRNGVIVVFVYMDLCYCLTNTNNQHYCDSCHCHDYNCWQSY